MAGKKTTNKKTDFLKLSIDDQVEAVHNALSDEVYPQLEMHGGGMEIMDIEGTDVLIRYYGACGHCPISESITLPFIEETLQKKVDSKIKVVIV
ncbi:hypothetical protein COY07_06280 [Candidatus Peregrinibacteria bacterium CG_4_10_14_0_2_um_filter_43_11]|nr:MAG: hypothetical protein COY07_06280 [Candidatus Peregrinibacteria bacterium CG_4_10_14_0_2_um_filter_43_11]